MDIYLIIFLVIIGLSMLYGFYDFAFKEKYRTYTTSCGHCRNKVEYKSWGTGFDNGLMKRSIESFKHGGDGRLYLECPHCHRNVFRR